MGAASPLLPPTHTINFLNIIRYGSKTRSICRKILKHLIVGFETFFFNPEETSRNLRKSRSTNRRKARAGCISYHRKKSLAAMATWHCYSPNPALDDSPNSTLDNCRGAPTRLDSLFSLLYFLPEVLSDLSEAIQNTVFYQ